MGSLRNEDGTLKCVHAIEFTDHRLLEGVVGFNLSTERELPRIVLRFAEVDGRMACVNVEIGADFEGKEGLDPLPVTTEVLRRIPLARLVQESLWKAVRQYDAVASGAFSPSLAEHAKARLPAARASTERPKRPGRPRIYDEKHYEEVASVYRQHSGGRAPTKAVTEHFRVTKSTAAKWVARARQMGLLD
jgi:hypothetical protein